MHDEQQGTGAVAPEKSDPQSSTTLIVGAVGFALLIVLVVLLEVLYYRTAEAEYQRKVVAEQPEELRRLQAAQLEQLNGYRWVDQQNGVVAVPIERAMELVVEEQRDRQGSRP